MKDMVNRLGFPVWADNLIVNAIEDMGGLPTDGGFSTDDCTVVVRVHDGKALFTVRAYVEGLGWQYHDRVINIATR